MMRSPARAANPAANRLARPLSALCLATLTLVTPAAARPVPASVQATPGAVQPVPDAVQSVPAAVQPSPALPASLVRVTIITAAGPIVLALETEKAPITAANFLKYVDGKRLDGTVFYRAVKVAPDYGFIQFGTQNEPTKTLPPIAHESTSITGLSHSDGAISMAMAAPGTARGDFFIIVGNTPAMDATANAPGYAVFGHVISGMDVVRHIMDLPTSPTKGGGIMKGQMLEPTLPVTSARRTPVTP